MTLDPHNKLRSRLDEINAFVRTIEILDRDQTKVLSGNARKIILSSDVKKILKASFFLVTYNAVEATVRDAFDMIYDDIQKNATLFRNSQMSGKNCS
jgi:hypothetical protein